MKDYVESGSTQVKSPSVAAFAPSGPLLCFVFFIQSIIGSSTQIMLFSGKFKRSKDLNLQSPNKQNQRAISNSIWRRDVFNKMQELIILRHACRGVSKLSNRGDSDTHGFLSVQFPRNVCCLCLSDCTIAHFTRTCSCIYWVTYFTCKLSILLK